MWESRVVCEISKVLWKPFCGFHSTGISIAVSRGRRDQRAIGLRATA
jgi:hypothetical protein